MANEKDVKRLIESVSAWNDWRERNSPNLANAHLTGASLIGANLSCLDLSGANLTGANLIGSNLSCANLRGVHLTGAHLSDANFSCADLSDAHLTGAHFGGTNFSGAIINRIAPADLRETLLRQGAAEIQEENTILDGGYSHKSDVDLIVNTSNSPHPLQTIYTTTPLNGLSASLCSLFAIIPNKLQHKNYFGDIISIIDSASTELRIVDTFDDALKIISEHSFTKDSPSIDYYSDIKAAIEDKHAIIGIRNPVEDLGPALLNNGFSVGSVVRLLEGGIAGQTIIAAIFIVAAGIIVIHLAKGIGRGLDKGGERVALALCERIAEHIRRPDTEGPQPNSNP
jgi:uncharacterized protein YjbI with pentapeptide repeats